MGRSKKPIANKLNFYICQHDATIFKFDGYIKLCKLICYLKSHYFQLSFNHYLQL